MCTHMHVHKLYAEKQRHCLDIQHLHIPMQDIHPYIQVCTSTYIHHINIKSKLQQQLTEKKEYMMLYQQSCHGYAAKHTEVQHDHK